VRPAIRKFVNVIPPEEFMSRYVFFTDPTYPETHLVIVSREEERQLRRR